MTTGSTTRVDAAISRLYATSCSLVKNARPTASGYFDLLLEVEQRQQELVPGRDGGEDRDDRDGRLGQRQDDPPEGLELARAVDPGGIATARAGCPS